MSAQVSLNILPKSPKARADHKYYRRNREAILVKAKARYRARLTESLNPHPEPQIEPPASLKTAKKHQSLLSQWIQHLVSYFRLWR